MGGERVALVAGARGIVGGNLVRKLLENGWSVIGVARSASEVIHFGLSPSQRRSAR